MKQIQFDPILGHLYEGVYVVDKERKIVFWNKGSELITGYSAEEVVNKMCYNNILRHVTEDGKALCFSGCPLHHTLQTGIVNSADVYLHHKDGHRVPVSVKSIPLYDGDQIVAAVEVFTDVKHKEEIIEENKELQKRLTRDELTKVANRSYLDFFIKTKFDEFMHFGNPFSVLFLDIDHFKDVNDTHGHLVGDEILKLVANTIKSNLRNTDVLGRWGGEEFIIVTNISNKDHLKKLAEKLRILVQKSSHKLKEDDNLNVTVSVGGAIIQEDDTTKSLVARSDDNMYDAKQSGRNKVIIK